MINKKRLLALTRKLIQLNSENPPGNESVIAGFVKKYFAAMGVKSKIYEFQRKRSNLIAVVGGEDSKHSLLITPHLDTVPAGDHWKFPPFSGKLQRGRIYGLGATDCKGNLAVSLEAMNSLIEDGTRLGYNLIFAATADEESGSTLGIVPLLDKGILKPDVALVLDADDFEIIVTQKGLIHLKVKIKGKKAHGAYPWLGRNAIDQSIETLEALKEHWALRRQRGRNQYLRPATLNIGTIKGGDKVNVVADWCEFELDYRFLPGDSARRILKEIKSVVKKHAARFQIEVEGTQNPYLIATAHPLVSCLVKAMKRLGRRPCIKGSEGATTISFFQEKGIPAVATGFGCSGCAHIADEYVRIDNLYRGAAVLEELLKQYQFD
jgi:acetylornithine deacetylase/succinyl-diaminopimelate desuccinylase family protein